MSELDSRLGRERKSLRPSHLKDSSAEVLPQVRRGRLQDGAFGRIGLSFDFRSQRRGNAEELRRDSRVPPHHGDELQALCDEVQLSQLDDEPEGLPSVRRRGVGLALPELGRRQVHETDRAICRVERFRAGTESFVCEFRGTSW